MSTEAITPICSKCKRPMEGVAYDFRCDGATRRFSCLVCGEVAPAQELTFDDPDEHDYSESVA